MQRKPLYAVALALAAVAAGIWLAQTRYAPQAPAAASDALWRLSLPDVEGKPQALSQWRGQVVVLNFWASWCAPCREEMPDFAALQTQYRAKGVVFVGVAIDNSANVARFLQRQPVDYPILVGEGAALALARQLGNPNGALPYTIVLDRDGRVALRHLGRLPRATLDAALRKLGA
jgi:thiol-disulfide isomerase/thioredoxin